MNTEDKNRGAELKRAIESSEYSAADIARIFDVSPQAINNWFKRGASAKHGVELGKLLRIAPNRISSIETTIYRNVEEPTSNYMATTIKRLPLISEIQAGSWQEAIDEFEPGDAAEWIATTGNFSEYSFALTVKGDSMTSHTPPSIPHGSTILVDPSIHPEHGKLVVAKLTDTNEVTFKRLSLDGPRKYLEPLNKEFDRIEVNGNCEIIGVVKQFITNL